MSMSEIVRQLKAIAYQLDMDAQFVSNGACTPEDETWAEALNQAEQNVLAAVEQLEAVTVVCPSCGRTYPTALECDRCVCGGMYSDA